jgi:hypothetical protein
MFFTTLRQLAAARLSGLVLPLACDVRRHADSGLPHRAVGGVFIQKGA